MPAQRNRRPPTPPTRRPRPRIHHRTHQTQNNRLLLAHSGKYTPLSPHINPIPSKSSGHRLSTPKPHFPPVPHLWHAPRNTTPGSKRRLTGAAGRSAPRSTIRFCPSPEPKTISSVGRAPAYNRRARVRLPYRNQMAEHHHHAAQAAHNGFLRGGPDSRRPRQMFPQGSPRHRQRANGHAVERICEGTSTNLLFLPPQRPRRNARTKDGTRALEPGSLLPLKLDSARRPPRPSGPPPEESNI